MKRSLKIRQKERSHEISVIVIVETYDDNAYRTKKHESALLIQLRTKKIEFNVFLHKIRVSKVTSFDYECSERVMTIEYVLLRCSK